LPELEAGNPRAVHRARVATRRLRELLPLLQLDRDTAGKLNRRLRRARRRLGTTRELDVLQHLTRELHESGRYPRHALRRVAESLQEERHKARTELPIKAIVAEMGRARRKLESVADALEAGDRKTRDRHWRWVLQARVARRATILKRAVIDAGPVYLSERLHAVRIGMKKLRYALELLPDPAGAAASADLRTLKRLQGLLGDLRDRQVLIDRVRSVQARARSSEASENRDLDALIIQLETSCRRMHARYVRERAAVVALCDRLSARASSESRPAARRAG
jgi:CHAD domain-containing protein